MTLATPTASGSAAPIGTAPQSQGSGAPQAGARSSRLGRLMRFISLLAIGLACALAANVYHNWGDPAFSAATSSQWMVGLVSGVALGWGTRIRWSEVPARFALWVRLQRRRLWWMSWGLAAAAILLFY